MDEMMNLTLELKANGPRKQLVWNVYHWSLTPMLGLFIILVLVGSTV